MGRQIIKQPDGHYAVFSSVVDDFVFVNATRRDIIRYFVGREVKEAIRGIRRTLKLLDAGDQPYHQFTMTYAEALRTIKAVHGKKHLDKVKAWIAGDRDAFKNDATDV